MVQKVAEDYRAKARECEENAETTTDPEIKQGWWLDLARQWRQMADQWERYGR